MTYCTKCGKPTDNGMICEDCMINDSPWLLAMKSKEDDLVEQIEKLKSENAALRDRLGKVEHRLALAERVIANDHEDCYDCNAKGIMCFGYEPMSKGCIDALLRLKEKPLKEAEEDKDRAKLLTKEDYIKASEACRTLEGCKDCPLNQFNDCSYFLDCFEKSRSKGGV